MARNHREVLDLLPHTYRVFYSQFERLYDIQYQCIQPILESRNVIVEARTGMGKTEAVLAPVLEKLIQNGRKFHLVYIAPTRALIYDIYQRYASRLFDCLNLECRIRTGDTKWTGSNRCDILLTTPESFDVLLGSKNRNIQKWVECIAVIIIDEVHSLNMTSRGKQLVYLLNRLKIRRNTSLQHIAMSATIADEQSMLSFFSWPSETCIIRSFEKKALNAHIVQIKNASQELPKFFDDLFHKWHYRKILVFANSRRMCDRLYATIADHTVFEGNCFIHYSNLEASQRKQIETRFKSDRRALCFATSTLELGIDVGNIDAVVLYEPPYNVSSFLQRIGRSNRRDTTTTFWAVCQSEVAHFQLLRFQALLNLANEGIVETSQAIHFPSVWVQQICSHLYERGQITPFLLGSHLPDIGGQSGPLIAHLQKNNWLRSINGVPFVFAGARKYWRSYMKREIWSCFPPSTVEYTLELNQRTIAIIPSTIVKQIKVGDRVTLAGKRILITDIIKLGQNRVMACPTNENTTKDLLWGGKGQAIPFEVAQQIKVILQQPKYKNNQTLFHRPSQLFDEIHAQLNCGDLSQPLCLLTNKEETQFVYLTFIGTIGNFILRQTILDYVDSLPDEEQLKYAIQADELAIYSSHSIPMNRIDMPTDRQMLRDWVSDNLSVLLALIDLNHYSKALPETLLVEELLNIIFDQRLLTYFKAVMEKERYNELVQQLPDRRNS